MIHGKQIPAASTHERAALFRPGRLAGRRQRSGVRERVGAGGASAGEHGLVAVAAVGAVEPAVGAPVRPREARRAGAAAVGRVDVDLRGGSAGCGGV